MISNAFYSEFIKGEVDLSSIVDDEDDSEEKEIETEFF